MQRRSFIRSLAIGVALLLGGVVGIGLVRSRGYIGRLVRSRLTYVNPSGELLEQFSSDFLTYSPSRLRKTLESVALFSGAYDLLQRIGMKTQKTALDEHILRVFLLSTDFFKRFSPEVRYTGFYDPHLFACQNPFARLD